MIEVSLLFTAGFMAYVNEVTHLLSFKMGVDMPGRPAMAVEDWGFDCNLSAPSLGRRRKRSCVGKMDIPWLGSSPDPNYSPTVHVQ